MMKIQKATINDLPMIMKTTSACVADLLTKGISQWNDNYPTEDIFIRDIDKGDLYIISEDDTCIAVIVINQCQEDEWKKVEWSTRSSRPLVVHRLMVHPGFQMQGVGRELMDFAAGYARGNGFDSIRFDAYSGNPGLLDTYEKMGCVRKGQVYFPHRELLFFCYEVDLG